MPLAFIQNTGPNTRLQKADTPVAHSLAEQMHTKPPPHPVTPSWTQHITKIQAGVECKDPMVVSHHGAPLRSPMYHLSKSPQELISSQRWKPPTIRFLQEASSTPLLLPRLEVREPPAGATCSKNTPHHSVELAKHSQRDSCDHTKPLFLQFCDRKSGSRVETRHPAAYSPRNPGPVCQPESEAPGLPGSQPQCTHRGRPSGPHHLEAPEANCEGLEEQRARTHPSS